MTAPLAYARRVDLHPDPFTIATVGPRIRLTLTAADGIPTTVWLDEFEAGELADTLLTAIRHVLHHDSPQAAAAPDDEGEDG